MRFLGRSQRREAVPYAIHPPYGEARSKLLSRRPAPEDDAAAGPAGTARPFGRLFAGVADVGLDTYLVSVYLFADGTISGGNEVGNTTRFLTPVDTAMHHFEFFCVVRDSRLDFEAVGESEYQVTGYFKYTDAYARNPHDQ